MTPPAATPTSIDAPMFATTVQSVLRYELDKFFVPLGFPRVTGVTVLRGAANIQVEFENGQTFDMHVRQLGR